MKDAELLKMCKDDPVFFCRHVLGVEPWSKQEEVLYSVRDNPNTIVVSCNAAGKSFISACSALWFLFTKPGSLVATTAPTFRQIKSVLWAEIARLYNGARVKLGGELLTTEINVGDKWTALGIPASDEVRFQGLHAPSGEVLMIFDEAAGIEPHIYVAAAGNLTSPDQCRWLLIGNPTSPSGQFYDYSKNPNWHKIQISAFDSPAIDNPTKYPYLVSKKWIEERAEEWGTSSPMYQARVLGQFPIEGDDTLIPLSWIDGAVRRYHEKNGKDLLVSDHVYLGVDVAYKGGDKTVCVTYQPNKIMPLKKQQGKELSNVKHLVTQEAISAGAKLQQITIDDTGLGGGPTSDLRAMGYPVLGVNFANKATNKRFFRRLTDEMAWNVREVFRTGEIAIPPDDELVNQLACIKYNIDQRTGLITIEAKEDVKKRGLRSPDCFWALALALWGSKRIRSNPATRPMVYRENRFSSNKQTKWY